MPFAIITFASEIGLHTSSLCSTVTFDVGIVSASVSIDGSSETLFLLLKYSCDGASRVLVSAVEVGMVATGEPLCGVVPTYS